MTDQLGQRQLIAQATPPDPGRDLLSAEQHEYVDQLAERQAAAARDPLYNGADAGRRLAGG